MNKFSQKSKKRQVIWIARFHCTEINYNYKQDQNLLVFHPSKKVKSAILIHSVLIEKNVRNFISIKNNNRIFVDENIIVSYFHICNEDDTT